MLKPPSVILISTRFMASYGPCPSDGAHCIKDVLAFVRNTREGDGPTDEIKLKELGSTPLSEMRWALRVRNTAHFIIDEEW